ncbi:MAG: hypothetical protein KL863_02455 [Rhizobium sp.]|nr:hypothetical protein [Rhizobium sp.]
MNTELQINSESGAMDLHHIYPKDWCANNKGGDLRAMLNADVAGYDWVNAASNLIPMHRRTNNEWRKMSPTTYLDTYQVNFDTNPDIWNRYFVSRELFDLLLQGTEGLEPFWKQRSRLIAQEIFDRCAV